MDQNKRELFVARTLKHIAMVRKNLEKFENYQGLSIADLRIRGEIHDQSKFSAEEIEAYTYLNWSYHTQTPISQEHRDLISQGLKTHALQNLHHPEAHNNVNDMSLLDLVEMIADWTAIAQENGKKSCLTWAQENLEKKWNFSDEKKELIFSLINEMDKKNSSLEIYFIRHGESEANVLGTLCGRTDVQLTPVGMEQVSRAAKEASHLSFDLILSSPLSRARSTAEIIAKLTPRSDLQTAQELIEQDYGIWEGRQFSEVKEEFLNTLNPPEGETHIAFRMRLHNLIHKLKNHTGRILLVSHGGVGSQLMEEYGLPKRLINNAEMVKLYETV